MPKDVIYPGPTVPVDARGKESVHHEAGIILKPGRITVQDDAWADRLIASGLVAPADAPPSLPVIFGGTVDQALTLAGVEMAAAAATEHVDPRPRGRSKPLEPKEE